jgi:hypothetical protein
LVNHIREQSSKSLIIRFCILVRWLYPLVKILLQPDVPIIIFNSNLYLTYKTVKMKKITYLFASLIMVALIVSCSKDATNDDDAMLKKAVATGPSAPVSYGPDGLPTGTDGIVPQIISGANNGGNRTCDEVAAAFPESNPFYCGNKIDYNNGAFAGAFPSGLDVTVTAGKYVSFEMDDCIHFGDKFYKVGAVIVKGSNAANVYFYPDGTMGDSGLASPINASGSPAGLSNLTFCFVECEPPLIIAVKCVYTDGVNNIVGISSGKNVFSNLWCGTWFLGINNYQSTSSFTLHPAGIFDTTVGNVTVVGGVLTIILLEGLTLNYAVIYVGTEANLTSTNLVDGCPDYHNNSVWRYTDTGTVTF